MTATVAADSAELINLEPHKCESWSWETWDSIVERRHSAPETLFEPMVHLIDGLAVSAKTPFV